MITKDNIEAILLSESFSFTKNRNVFTRHYGTDEEGFNLSYNYGAGTFDYPDGVDLDRSTTQDNYQKESYVVFLCVAQLFAIGYKPNQIKLEGENYKGNKKGFCDILIKDNNGDEYLIIECKTAEIIQKKDDEFRKHWAKTLRNGDQLFRYFNTYRKAKYLCLLAADYPEYRKEDGTKANKFEFIYHLISLIDNEAYLQSNPALHSFQQQREEQGGSEDFFNVWKKTYKQDYSTRGLLEEGVEAFNIGKESYNLDSLDTVNEYSLQKKYNDFAVILRKYTISSHENAFDKLVNLFLSKIIDEKYNGNELTFLWKGAAYDDDFSLQDRLNILYRQGMMEFFKDEVTYIENQQIEAAFDFLTSKADEGKETIKRYFRQLKYFNNNPFAFLDVHNEELFYKNAVILKDVISMLQGIHLTKHDNNQFLGDLFEGFLNKGVHQSEGQFFTPIPIVRFLVSSLPLQDIIEKESVIPRVIDYACGAGHFLTEYARQIKSLVAKETLAHYYEQIVGIEKDYRLSKVSQVAAFMYGMDGIRIHFSDALIDIPEIKEHSFDVLVANPPYSVSGFLDTLEEEEQQHYSLSKYVSNPEKNNSIETFFIERASQLLAPGGVAAIIVPPSILTKGNLYMRTRELLLENFDIIAICCFGKNTFGQTSTSTVTLFLRRKRIEPDIAKHLKNRIDTWFSGNMDDDDFYKDSPLLDAYLDRMKYQRADYIALMRGYLSETFKRTDMIQEYIKALNVPKKGDNTSATALAIDARKVREEAQKYVDTPAYKNLTQEGREIVISNFQLRFIRAIEKEKLYFFMLTFSNSKSSKPQPVLVIHSPEKKDEEKKFLGYEWSSRKGAEGIHYLNTGKIVEAGQDDEDAEDDTISQIMSVDDINTPLFNPKDLNDEAKINVLIRKNYEGKDTFDIPEELEDRVKIYSLADLLTFSNTEFDKVMKVKPIIALPKIETTYPTLQLGKVAPYINNKVSLSSTVLQTYVSTENMIEGRNGVKPNEGLPKIDKVTNYQKGDILVSNIRPYLKKIWMATHNGGCSNDILVFRNIQPEVILNDYLYQILASDIFFDYMNGSSKGMKMPRGDKKSIPYFDIPSPPKEIQSKIAKECAAIDLKRFEYLHQIEEAESSIMAQLSSVHSEEVKLSSIFSLSSGKMLSKKNREDGVIPVYGGNGVTGYHNQSFVDANTIVIGRVGEYCGSVHLTDKPAWITDNALYVREYKMDAVPKYVLYALKKLNLNQYANRTGQPNISQSSIANVLMTMPSKEDQEHIAKEIEKLEVQINEARSFIEGSSAKKQEILDKYLK